MKTFSSNGVEIAYVVEGEGQPVLLIHGFASNIDTNWRQTRWIDFLNKNGFQVIALDNRGHGESQKLYDPADYTGPLMAEDSFNLLNHLGIEKTNVMGYSMGARLAAFLSLAHPYRINRTILSGLGANMIQGVGAPEPVADALLTDPPANITNTTALGFRIFADQTKSDRRALAACIMASRDRIPGDELARLSMPVLVAVGTVDEIAGPATPLAKVIPGAKVLDIPGRDHMKAVGDRLFKQGAVDFFKDQDNVHIVYPAAQ